MDSKERLTKVLQQQPFTKLITDKHGRPVSERTRLRRLETFIRLDPELQALGAAELLKKPVGSPSDRLEMIEELILSDNGDRQSRVTRLETYLQEHQFEDDDEVDVQVDETEAERQRRLEGQWPPDESKFGSPKPKDMPKAATEGEPYAVGTRYITKATMKLRKTEDSTSPILTTLQPSTYVEIIDKGQNQKRVKVRVSEMDGWIPLCNASGESLLDEVPAEQHSAMILDYTLGKFSSGLESIAKSIRADEGQLPQKVYPNMKPREKPVFSTNQVGASTLTLLEQSVSLSGRPDPSQHAVRKENAGLDTLGMKHHSHQRLHNAMSQMAFLLAQRGKMQGQHSREEQENRNLRMHIAELRQKVNFTKKEAQYWQKRSGHDTSDFVLGYQSTATQGHSPYEVQEATMAIQGCVQQVKALKQQLRGSE